MQRRKKKELRNKEDITVLRVPFYSLICGTISDQLTKYHLYDIN